MLKTVHRKHILLLLLLLLLLLSLLIYFIYLFHLKFIYLLIRGPIRLGESPFSRFFDSGMLQVEGVS